MYFIFDTETNGIGKQNHMLSIGWIILDTDLNKIEVDYKLFKRHDLSKKTWNKEAERVHGITYEESRMLGEDVREALPEILEKMKGKTLVAHNMKFDYGVIKSDCERLQIHGPEIKGKICTMLTAKMVWTNESKGLKNTFNRIFPNTPFDEKFQHHNGLDDAKACACIFHHFIKKGIIKIKKPSVDKTAPEEEQLSEIMTQVYDLLKQARELVPFFKGIVEYKGKNYWAELQLNRNPFEYPDVEEYYWQSKFGLPQTGGFWYDLYELDRTGQNPAIGRNISGRPILTTGNQFDRLKPSLNGSYRITDFRLIRKIC